MNLVVPTYILNPVIQILVILTFVYLVQAYTIHDLNVIFYLILDITQLYHPSCVSFSFDNCCITDHGIESATTILINRAKSAYFSFVPVYALDFGFDLYDNQFTHKPLMRYVLQQH